MNSSKDLSKKLNTCYASIHGSYWMYFGVLGGFSSVYLLFKGYSNSEIGIILAVANVLAVLVQPFLAELADRGSKRALFTIIEVVAVLNLILSTWMITAGGRSVPLTIAFTLTYALMMTNQPFINAVNRRLEETGIRIAFGTCRSIGSLAFAVICYILGIFVERLSPGEIPIVGDLAIALIIISVALTYRAYKKSGQLPVPSGREPFPEPHRELPERSDHARATDLDQEIRRAKTAPEDTSAISLREFISDHKTFFLMSFGILGLYLANGVPNTYMAQIVTAAGGGSKDVGGLFAFLALTEIPTMILFDRIYRKFSCEAMLKFASAAFVVWLGAFIISKSIRGLYLAQLIHFFAFPLFLPAMVRFIDDNMRAGEAVKGQTLFTIMITIGNMLASLLGGWILDLSGVNALLIFGTVTAVAGAAIIILMVDRVEADD